MNEIETLKEIIQNEKDLISRSALIEAFHTDIVNHMQYIDDSTVSVCISEIEEAPTVDAVPVVHGRWEVVMHKQDIAYYAQCDHCGFEHACGSKGLGSLIDELEPFFYNYCPNCGALMDGGEEE